MDKKDIKEKATQFGRKFLEVGKELGKLSVEAGKEIAHEASLVGQSLAKDVSEAVNRFEESAGNRDRLKNRQGTWFSTKILPQAFEDVETNLRLPMASFRMNVHADSSISRITADRKWTEDVPGLKYASFEAHLQLDFESQDEDSTLVTYLWTVTEFPRGAQLSNLIVAVNGTVEAALSGSGEPVEAKGPDIQK